MTDNIVLQGQAFYASLEEIASTIMHARTEIAAIQPDSIKATHIAPAHDELDAVVGATEDATNRIMDECEAIMALAAQCSPEAGRKLTEHATKIFEACNFQDITGQRITKVVSALKHIDSKIEALLQVLDKPMAYLDTRISGSLPVPASSGLLNGPQLPASTPTQADIDLIFESLDQSL